LTGLDVLCDCGSWRQGRQLLASFVIVVKKLVGAVNGGGVLVSQLALPHAIPFIMLTTQVIVVEAQAPVIVCLFLTNCSQGSVRRQRRNELLGVGVSIVVLWILTLSLAIFLPGVC
jgi:hypothetical protein